ncbi:MAG: hypothetical protein GWP59_07190 [Chlamydiales bacterium]|nr:GrpB family protein [Chlamydiales bacterium]NCF71469.1 hypothetical protein [Chlamydiales bacterium]
MSKYTFKPYEASYPSLFKAEKQKIEQKIPFAKSIEHVGSTAVVGLGGKGIIDIAIELEVSKQKQAIELLQSLGYFFEESFSTENRLFFKKHKSTENDQVQNYHIHLFSLHNDEFYTMLNFRDSLNSHPEKMQEYAAIKQKAVKYAKEDGKLYRSYKEPFIDSINQLKNKS